MSYPDIRTSYSIIHLFRDLSRDIVNSPYMKELKRHCRAIVNKESGESTILFDNGYDGFCRKHVYPILTDEVAQSIAKEMEIIPYNSQYDCTGQIFTTNINVFHIPAVGKTIIYHFLAFDV